MTDQIRIRIAGAMKNGSRLEAASIAVHDRIARASSLEFQERLAAAHADEVRHTAVQRDLASRLWDSPLPSGDGIRILATRCLDMPLDWAQVALRLTEAAFAVRLQGIARRARQVGLRMCYAPLMEIAQDETRHVRLVSDLLRSQPDRPSDGLIEDVSCWLQQNELADTSGLFPADQLIPLVTARLILEMN